MILCLLDTAQLFTWKLTKAVTASVRWVQSPLHYAYDNIRYLVQRRKLSKCEGYCSEEKFQRRVRGGEMVVRVIMPPNSVDTCTKV